MSVINIRVDDKTKAGEYLIGIAKLLSGKSNEIEIEEVVVSETALKDSIDDITEIKEGIQKTIPLDELLKELSK